MPAFTADGQRIVFCAWVNAGLALDPAGERVAYVYERAPYVRPIRGASSSALR